MENIKKEKKTADIKAYMKEYNKNYRESNRELTREYSRDYYNRNKDEVKAKFKEKMYCELCGATVSKQYLPKHKLRDSCKLKAGKLDGKKYNPKVMIEVELYDKLKKLLEKEELKEIESKEI